ncbi:hypothetical protein [Porticoccus sp.]|uniref:hypothetical protein n=1 Tax=Porticoccus sp. TaxID=2024853 RepID=UPI003F6A1D95
MGFISMLSEGCQHVVLVLAVATGSCLSRHLSILLIVYQFRHPGIFEDGLFLAVTAFAIATDN